MIEGCLGDFGNMVHFFLSIYTKILANLKKSQNHIFVSQEPSVALGPLELLLWKGQVDPELAKSLKRSIVGNF